MAKKKFNLTELLTPTSMGNEAIETPEITMVKVSSLRPSKDNFYNTDKIDELKLSLELIGIQQPIVAKPLEDGNYEIIAGHRRHMAAIELSQAGNKAFDKVPCIIKNAGQLIKEKLALIMTNSTTRVISDWELMQQSKVVKVLLEEWRKQEELDGRTRDIVAGILQTSTSKIAKMEAIDNHLIPEFKEEFKENKVGTSAAYEVSSLPEERQKEVYEKYKEKGELKVKDVQKEKEKPAIPQDGGAKIEELPADTEKPCENIPAPEPQAIEAREESPVTGGAEATQFPKSKYPFGYSGIKGFVSGIMFSDAEIVITGQPVEDETHDCDFMGCEAGCYSSFHVLFRAYISNARKAD